MATTRAPLITIRGARVHNLKDVDCDIPRGRLTVITGPSGSGKSSLAFDTLYAEGQRRYVETLSPHARQFLDQLPKPDVDAISGLPPAVAIEQRTMAGHPRSTVGTATEIYDHLRVLFAVIGQPHCPRCGSRVASQAPGPLAERLTQRYPGRAVVVLAPVVRGRRGAFRREWADLADGASGGRESTGASLAVREARTRIPPAPPHRRARRPHHPQARRDAAAPSGPREGLRLGGRPRPPVHRVAGRAARQPPDGLSLLRDRTCPS